MKRLASSGFAAITAMLAIACGPTARPASPSPSPSPSDQPAASVQPEAVTVCEAIARAVDALPDVAGLALDPDGIEADQDVPSRLEVEGAIVTVMTGESPDLTIMYEAGGTAGFDDLRDVFLGCPVFTAADWARDGDGEVDAQGAPRLAFSHDDGSENAKTVWMKVMSSGDLLICAHTY